MRPTAPAVAAAKAWPGEPAPILADKPGHEIALLTALNGQDVFDISLGAQAIDMPMRPFIDTQMPSQSGPEATGPVGAAAIEIAAGGQFRPAQAFDRQDHGAPQSQKQHIGAAGGRQAVGIESYCVFSPVLLTVTVSPARTKDTVPLEAL